MAANDAVLGRASSERVVSPELVLVDQELGSAARAELPESDDILTSVLDRMRSHQRSRASVERLLALGEEADEGEVGFRRLGSHTRVALGLVSMLASGIIVALALHVHGEQTHVSASVPTIEELPRLAVTNVPSGQPGRQPSTSTTTNKPAQLDTAPTARRLAWAPVKNASGYHLELYRGATEVFAANTVHPEATVPAGWTIGGHKQTLAPGEYRWYVWPLVAGRRASDSTVQAKLVIPRS